LGELENAGFVFARSKAQEEGGFLLPAEFAQRPVFGDGLLFVETAFKRVFDGEQFDNVSPRQFVRQCRTNWVGDEKLPHPIEVAPVKSLAVE
jgi:hypothetical protein